MIEQHYQIVRADSSVGGKFYKARILNKIEFCKHKGLL